MSTYANGTSRPVDASLQWQVTRLLGGHTFRTVPYLDKDSVQTLRHREFRAMAKVKGMRTLVIMVKHELTGDQCTVLYDRTGRMHHIKQVYTEFIPNTVLDGVITLEAEHMDGEIYDGNTWIYLFFDVLLYRGANLYYFLRPCIGAMFARRVVHADDDCFVWRWQHSYPLERFCDVFERDTNTYNVEGVVFKCDARLLKWNFPPKRRGIVHVRGVRCKDGKIELELLTSDGSRIGHCLMNTEDCVRALLRNPTLPRMECVWRNNRWELAKPCTDHDAHTVTELNAVKDATAGDITVEYIKLYSKK